MLQPEIWLGEMVDVTHAIRTNERPLGLRVELILMLQGWWVYVQLVKGLKVDDVWHVIPGLRHQGPILRSLLFNFCVSTFNDVDYSPVMLYAAGPPSSLSAKYPPRRPSVKGLLSSRSQIDYLDAGLHSVEGWFIIGLVWIL